MTQYAIVTDLNLCVGCLACSVACKAANSVPIGNFWEKMLRIGPNPKEGGSGQWPDVEMYFLPVQCQHCANPACVEVCPTEASHKLADGTVQVDKEKCIGCQFCAMACPYGVRYLNEEERVVEKCTLCEQKISQGELPQCVAQCGGRARFFGDIEQGLDSFVGPSDAADGSCSYESLASARVKMGDFVNDFSDSDVYALPNVGNDPSFLFILRDRKWQG
ncbi:4Fe-4S dicluster domain-containing protein [Parvibacter caecicola]|uniref:4Fe-4S dicluster domain-containing protein n=1 Tax=Parvibacter caecicola TaxID=747645 RepID=UPI00249C5E99|nr:4Fe-4S dicluster domain-containing protein [Parvibacter caecicola]